MRGSLIKAVYRHLAAEVQRQQRAEEAGAGVHVAGGVPVVVAKVHGGVVEELRLHEVVNDAVHGVAEEHQRAGAPLGGVALVLGGKLGVRRAHLLLALVEATVHIVLDAQRGARSDVLLEAYRGRVVEADPGCVRLVDDLAHARSGEAAGATDECARRPIRKVREVGPRQRLALAHGRGGCLVDAPGVLLGAEGGRREAGVRDDRAVDALELGVEDGLKAVACQLRRVLPQSVRLGCALVITGEHGRACAAPLEAAVPPALLFARPRVSADARHLCVIDADLGAAKEFLPVALLPIRAAAPQALAQPRGVAGLQLSPEVHQPPLHAASQAAFTALVLAVPPVVVAAVWDRSAAARALVAGAVLLDAVHQAPLPAQILAVRGALTRGPGSIALPDAKVRCIVNIHGRLLPLYPVIALVLGH
mmetsp:Transcript_20038/g.52306  ORF Transcript_20038/g.52306 Transcript_20038/m.52306 type:complete len:420 (+) Transcript_20038:481-1740(+)